MIAGSSIFSRACDCARLRGGHAHGGALVPAGLGGLLPDRAQGRQSRRGQDTAIYNDLLALVA